MSIEKNFRYGRHEGVTLVNTIDNGVFLGMSYDTWRNLAGIAIWNNEDSNVSSENNVMEANSAIGLIGTDAMPHIDVMLVFSDPKTCDIFIEALQRTKQKLNELNGI